MTSQNPDWKALGEWLRGKRTARGWTKRQAAEFAEISASTWANLEAGGRVYRGEWIDPSPEDTTLTRIANLFDEDRVTVFELAGRAWVEPPKAATPPSTGDRRGHEVETRIAALERWAQQFDRRQQEQSGLLDEILRRLPETNNRAGRAKT